MNRRIKTSETKTSTNECTWTTSNCLPRKKRIENPDPGSDCIQSKYRDGVSLEECVMLLMKNGKKTVFDR